MRKNEMVLNYLSVLSEMHNKKLSQALQKIYIKVLSKYSYSVLEIAFDKVINNCTFFPKPVEIIKYIVGGSDDRSLYAWTKVIDAVRKYGAYESVDFGDPLIAKAIRLIGGWKFICNTNSKEMVWMQKEFERIYKNLIISGYSSDNSKVSGIIESVNMKKGEIDEIPDPIQIGSKQKLIKGAE